jgi:oligogalacturonide lyase
VTKARAVHHHLYFGPGTWSADRRSLLLVSYRTGFPNLFRCDWGCGEIRQMTARIDLAPFSVAPSPTRRECFFSARDEVVRINIDSLEETVLARFPGHRTGVCSVDKRGERVAVSARRMNGVGEIAVIAADGSGSELILEGGSASRPQFCPADPNLILYSRDRGRSLRTVRADGSEDRLLYEARDGERVLHESWLGGRGEVLFTTPAGVLRALRPGGSVRTILERGVWHAYADREGNRVVCDSREPRRGIFTVDPSTGETETVLRVKTSGMGTWWKDPGGEPAEDIETAALRSDEPEAERAPGERVRETLYGPEWTHLHPVFDPGGTRTVFTSNRGGWPQVYVLESESA